ncbi:hypothetical protein TanjilG_10890 [Lupinus angustifolius]|uniref:Uncharacterized protein n=1 Tax=Lupinus angustifolius TaxID=3871 RepID=A0A1J7G402_LUPAN|nr:PREDICTED: uncharacterized protein LOC109329414 [Lupinus angustifolius]XP_019418625.1 PREDICTED: uncharacterized protein LOC109329415 [Lupinus angustifolius]OIV95070.1 hypothetical protein TanjilG_10890 [Lupinus angustifolius]
MNAPTSINIVQGEKRVKQLFCCFYKLNPYFFLLSTKNGNESDSDANSNESPEHYQPISAVEDNYDNSDGEHHVEFHQLPNAKNGISYLDLNDSVKQKISDEEEEGEEDEERMRETSIRRAFSEEENQRSAPLTVENATRVMEAMCGVSFGGVAPDWVAEVPEDCWIDQLHRLRQTPNT